MQTGATWPLVWFETKQIVSKSLAWSPFPPSIKTMNEQAIVQITTDFDNPNHFFREYQAAALYEWLTEIICLIVRFGRQWLLLTKVSDQNH